MKKYVISENRMVEIVGKMINAKLPNFNRDETKVYTFSDGDETYLGYYPDYKKTSPFARYYVRRNELELDYELFIFLLDNLGEHVMTHVIDWFNNEFNQHAEYISIM